jgi:uncharacterized protein
MTISMYNASAGVFIRVLSSLAHILRKGAEHAAAHKIEDKVFLEARLYPDMFPLAAQVRIVTDFSRGACARLAGGEPEKWEDNETTFAELIERLRKTIAHLKTLKPEQFDDGTRMVTFPTQGDSKTWPSARYLYTRVLPNVFFHCTTTYNILRHNGVEIGKADFLGPLDG